MPKEPLEDVLDELEELIEDIDNGIMGGSEKEELSATVSSRLYAIVRSHRNITPLARHIRCALDLIHEDVSNISNISNISAEIHLKEALKLCPK